MIEKIYNDIIKETCLKYTHDSGLEVYMLPMEGYSAVSAQFSVRFGSVDNAFKLDNGEHRKIPDGTAHYLEHKLFESEEKDAFKLFAQTGASCNACTSYDYTQYYFSCAENFGKNLEILLDFVQQPYFTPENVEKERGIIGQEITMYRDSPNWRVFTNLLAGMYKENPVRIDIAGTADSIAEITDEILYDCYNVFYSPDNMSLCIAGKFDPDEAVRICGERLKNRAPVGTATADFNEPRTAAQKLVELSMPVAKPIFEIGFKRPPLDGAEQLSEYFGFDILFETIFGRTSDFFTDMRDKGLINDQFANGVLSGRGFFIPFLRGESDDTLAVAEEVGRVIRAFKAYPPAREDFERIKRSTYGSLVRDFTNADSVASTLSEAAPRGLSPFSMIDAAARASYEQMTALLSNLDEDNICISIIKGE